ncbi:hypothetical protein Vretifemale_12876, partial [Volvox reticuliferus]
ERRRYVSPFAHEEQSLGQDAKRTARSSSAAAAAAAVAVTVTASAPPPHVPHLRGPATALKPQTPKLVATQRAALSLTKLQENKELRQRCKLTRNAIIISTPVPKMTCPRDLTQTRIPPPRSHPPPPRSHQSGSVR